jgi:DNA-binding MarR family transcriptional regulator
MNAAPPSHDDLLRRSVDSFWESYLPFWGRVRAQLRQTAVEQFDISEEQFHILRHIRKGHGSVSTLADARHISRAAASQVVEILVEKGLVTRTQDTVDRRHVQLSLTSEGSTLLDAIFGQTRLWMVTVLAPLSDADLQNLIDGTTALRKTGTP